MWVWEAVALAVRHDDFRSHFEFMINWPTTQTYRFFYKDNVHGSNLGHNSAKFPKRLELHLPENSTENVPKFPCSDPSRSRVAFGSF